MAKVTEAVDLAANRFNKAGRDFMEGAKNIFKKSEGMTDEALAAATKPGILQKIVVAPVKAGWYVVSRPIAWTTQLAGYSAEKLGAGFKAHPKMGAVALATGAALGIGHVMNKREERNAQMDMAQLQAAAAQQQAAMAQAQANTVTPAEYAAMEARMKQGGQAGQGFAAQVRANQAAPAGPTV